MPVPPVAAGSGDPDPAADAAALDRLGYSARWRALFEAVAADGRVPARVVRGDRGGVVVAAAAGTLRAEPSAGLRRAAEEQPTCGDWVVLDPAPTHEVGLIEAVLPRVSAFTRSAPDGTSTAQVVAANVDTILVVHPIEPEPSARRIERELALAFQSGALPVVVLTKADLTDEAAARTARVREVAVGVEVVLTSAADGTGLDTVRGFAGAGRTVALIGPSGAGKSTLINALLGEGRQATREVRVRDGRGRHTTVTRELVPLPGGGVLLDTPGMRVVGMVDADTGIDAAFADVTALAQECRFRDCTHGQEPGCAVLAGVEAGRLPEERLTSWRALQREARVAAMRTDVRLRNEEVRRWKVIQRGAKEHYRLKGKDPRA